MKKLFLILLIFPAFLLQAAYAESMDEQAFDIFGADALEQGLTPEEAKISGKVKDTLHDHFDSLSRLWKAFFGKITEEIRLSLGFFAKLFSVILFSAYAGAICTTEKIRSLVDICAACAAAVLLIGSMDGLVTQTADAIYRLSDYSRAALPVVYTAAAASGAIGSAAPRYAAASFAFDVMMGISQRLVIPLVYAALSLALSNVLFPNPLLAAVEKGIKWAAKTAMTGTALTFTIYLKINSIIGTSVDAAAVKATRSILSGALPVVGGMISDASATVLSAAAIVRNCTGAFGLAAVCAICAGPFAVLSVKCFLLKAVAAAADCVQNSRLQKLLSGLGSAVGMLMGLLGCSAVMLFLSFTTAMKAVSS